MQMRSLYAIQNLVAISGYPTGKVSKCQVIGAAKIHERGKFTELKKTYTYNIIL